MLVLSRKLNQKIVVRDANDQQLLELTVVLVRGDKVRLGFKAEPTVKVNRLEVDEQKQQDQQAQQQQ